MWGWKLFIGILSIIAGIWARRRLRLEEVHRFPNGGVMVNDSLRGGVMRLWGEIQEGLTLRRQAQGQHPFGNVFPELLAGIGGSHSLLRS